LTNLASIEDQTNSANSTLDKIWVYSTKSVPNKIRPIQLSWPQPKFSHI